jgi:hypothetical protein
MYFLSLSVTLLVIIASVHLLAKVRNENLGILSKLLAYFVLLTAVLILACQLFRGVDKMERGGKKCKKECSSEMMMGGEGDHHMMMKKCHKEGGMDGKCMKGGCKKGECPHMGEDGKCAMAEGKECPMECCKDSAMKGECKMHKEVEVIIKEGDKE